MNINPTTEQIVSLTREHIFILVYILIGFGLMGMYKQWGFSGRFLFGLVFPLHWILHWWIQLAWYRNKWMFFLLPLFGAGIWAVAALISGIIFSIVTALMGMKDVAQWGGVVGAVLGVPIAIGFMSLGMEEWDK